MKGILLTHKGMEDVAAIDVDELIKQESKEEEGCVTFNIKSYDDLFKLCYKSQSAGKICLLLSEFKIKDLENDFKKEVEKINFQEYINKEETIQLRVKNNNKNIKTPTVELERELSAAIIKSIHKKNNYKQKVNLKTPDIPIFIYITEKKCYLGIDFAGFDLSKRAHHIFTHPSDIKGTVGFGLVLLSDFQEDDILIDPFATSGTIPIEAALYAANFPVNFYNKEKFAFRKFNIFKENDFDTFFQKEDKKIVSEKFDIYNADAAMKNINFAKKNAQIAGILKNMEFRRMQMEWFDTKFDENEVNNITTKMPHTKNKDNEKNYKELFYQADFVLAKDGILTLIGQKNYVEKYAKEYKFNIEENRQIHSGKESYDVFILTKESKTEEKKK